MDSVRRISLRAIPAYALSVLLTASWFLAGTAAAQENPAGIPAVETQTAPVPETDRNMFREATFMLPEGAAISPRWVLPPTEITRIDAEFSVDASGNPLIGEGSLNSNLVNPIEGYKIVVEEKISGFTHLDNGVLLLAAGRSIGLLAEPKQKVFDDKKVPIAGFQPLTSLPLKEISVLASAGNAVYCAGLNPQTGRYALYLLRVVNGAGVKDLELIHESDDAITAVTGDDEATYVAKGSAVVRVFRKDGSVMPKYTHPSAAVTDLEIIPAGLLVSTNKELVLAGENGAMEIMRSSGHRIDYRGNTLYLFFIKSMGVLALDNTADLGRFNLAVRPVADGEVPPPLEITGVNFFESAPPPYAETIFADSFDRENVRSIVAQIDYESSAAPEETGRHTITVSWYEPMGGRLLSTSYPVRAGDGRLFASIGAEPGGEGYTPPPVGTGGSVWRFGDDRLGLRYPGRYRVAVQVDGIPAGEWSFALTGNPKPAETLIYNDLTALETLLNEGLSPRNKNEGGTPLLNNAVLFGSARSVELLLNRGADPNDVNSDGIPALAAATGMFPAGADWRAKAELLVNRGANVDALVGKDKEPLIHRNTFQPDRMAFLIEKGADINVQSAFKATVLGEVVSSERLCSGDMISLLVRHGANLNAPFDSGLGSFEKYTPLGLAISDGNYECVSALLDNGASLSVAQARHNATTPERSALYIALQGLYAEKKDTERASASRRIVQLLLEKGASLNRGKKLADLPFDPACAERYDNSECYSRTMDNSLMLMQGEGRIMFRGEGPSIFSTSDMIMALEQDDAALDEADKSTDPKIRELALKAHLGRIRELAAAARNIYGLYDAYDHCKKAFSLAEPRYRAMQLDVVPDIQGASKGGTGKSFLGAFLLKREEEGAYVQRLAGGGAAEKTGLRVGDIILALDTRKMKDADEIASTVSRLTPGMPVRVTFLRDDPMLVPDLHLTCGLLEKGMDKKELAEMNLIRWLSENPDAPQAREVQNHIKELTKETKR